MPALEGEEILSLLTISAIGYTLDEPIPLMPNVGVPHVSSLRMGGGKKKG